MTKYRVELTAEERKQVLTPEFKYLPFWFKQKLLHAKPIGNSENHIDKILSDHTYDHKTN